MGMTIKIGAEVVAAALLLPVQVVSALVPSVAMPSVTIAGVPVTDSPAPRFPGTPNCGMMAAERCTDGKAEVRKRARSILLQA